MIENYDAKIINAPFYLDQSFCQLKVEIVAGEQDGARDDEAGGDAHHGLLSVCNPLHPNPAAQRRW